ncbi:hypothetical protein F751_3905 [Auxenochlorella protothecoides]|uniref:Uncharacterized protein n=1 Tax=Auxenochlorella protothecoides TaxID=3075 RepID=A0A087SD85_AUXPR|nr:hypothetical protein F751_3905 [Auxenochlorella protothecoides]KFM23689.1 hypothetical protein F751_3905 [Auxenochlorella protothecoides]
MTYQVREVWESVIKERMWVMEWVCGEIVDSRLVIPDWPGGQQNPQNSTASVDGRSRVLGSE